MIGFYTNWLVLSDTKIICTAIKTKLIQFYFFSPPKQKIQTAKQRIIKQNWKERNLNEIRFEIELDQAIQFQLKIHMENIGEKKLNEREHDIE